MKTPEELRYLTKEAIANMELVASMRQAMLYQEKERDASNAIAIFKQQAPPIIDKMMEDAAMRGYNTCTYCVSENIDKAYISAYVSFLGHLFSEFNPVFREAARWRDDHNSVLTNVILMKLTW